jgi:hypothetical protein
MLPLEAAKILDLPVDAAPEQIETRFQELRAKLEDKIAKAPTPGLKTKYRESLDDITAAFEALTLAADSSALPMLQRQRTEDGGQRTAKPSPDSGLRSQVSGLPAKSKASHKEFLIVAVIALAVLGGGAWWVMKTRAEEAEKARLVTELAQKAADQKAEAERAAVAAAKLAEEEKARLAAAAKAEETRREQLGLQLRTRISELNITLDALLKTESLAERELSDLKAEERSLQREAKGGSSPDLRAAQAALQAYDRYVTWLRDHLAANPARLARAKLDELAGAKAWDEVAAALEPYATAIKQLQADIPAKRDQLLVLTGTLSVTAEPAEVDFQLQDSYGRLRSGHTPAQLTDVPFGTTTVTFQRAGWPAQSRTATIKRDAPANVAGDLVGGSLKLTSTPFPSDFTLTGQGRSESGRTPATLPELPVGNYQITYTRTGWPNQTASATVTRGGNATAEGAFAPPGTLKVTSQPAGASVTFEGKIVGTTPLTLSDLPPGPVAVELARDDYRPAALQGVIEAGKETVLAATLRSATLTPEEAYEALARDAKGTWTTTFDNIIAGNVRLYIRLTPGSKLVQYEQTGFGGSVRNLTMVGYDPVTKVVFITFSGLDALNGKLSLRLEGDTLLFGRGDLTKNPQIFRRE